MNHSLCAPPASRWSIAILGMVAGLARVLADDSETFNKSLAYTNEVIAKHHLIALVEIEPLDDGKETKFRYDRYPEMERVQLGKNTYIRKKGKSWVESEDWGVTSKKIKPAKAAELDGLVSFPDAPLKNRMIAKDKAQGGMLVELTKREKDGDKERLHYEVRRENSTNLAYPEFVFSPWKAGNDEESLLIGYGGLMYAGDEKVKVNINYQYMFLVNLVEKKPDPVPPEAGKPAEPGKAEDKGAEGQADEDKVYTFTELGRQRAALKDKVVKVEITTENAVGKKLTNGLTRAMVHDTGKPHSFIGLVDFPTDQFKKIGLADESSKKTLTVYVRVHEKSKDKDAPQFTAMGSKAIKDKDGATAYEW